MKEYKYTIEVREKEPLDGPLLEVIEFSAPCLNNRWIEILKLAVNKGPNCDVSAAIWRNGKYIGSLHHYDSDCISLRGIHLNSKHYTKITSKI